MFNFVFLGVVVGVLLWALVAKRLSRTILTLPIIFAVLGYAIAAPVREIAGHEVLYEITRLVAEATLIVVLFADASHVRLHKLTQNFMLPLRMLLVGMPLAILAGTVAVYLVTPFGNWALAMLTAAILTPTDAALGASVVGSDKMPDKLRQTINVESGLNDGLALPFVLIGAIWVSQTSGHGGLAADIALQLLLGPLAGAIVGWSAAKAMTRAQDRDWVSETSGAIVFLSTAFAAYFLAGAVGGNGFIAAFVAGGVFGNVYKRELMFISEFMEGQGQVLAIAAFVIFGAVLLPEGIAHFSVAAVSVSILFLTVVRVIPIVVSLIGTQTSGREKLFLGWFGPRGLASVLFVLIAVEDFNFVGENELLACVVMTVGLSILVHGVSAAPLVRMFATKS